MARTRRQSGQTSGKKCLRWRYQSRVVIIKSSTITTRLDCNKARMSACSHASKAADGLRRATKQSHSCQNGRRPDYRTCTEMSDVLMSQAVRPFTHRAIQDAERTQLPVFDIENLMWSILTMRSSILSRNMGLRLGSSVGPQAHAGVESRAARVRNEPKGRIGDLNSLWRRSLSRTATAPSSGASIRRAGGRCCTFRRTSTDCICGLAADLRPVPAVVCPEAGFLRSTPPLRDESIDRVAGPWYDIRRYSMP